MSETDKPEDKHCGSGSELSGLVMRAGPTVEQFIEAHRQLAKAGNSTADAMRAFGEMAEKMKIKD
jgi:hypothetical protein